MIRQALATLAWGLLVLLSLWMLGALAGIVAIGFRMVAG